MRKVITEELKQKVVQLYKEGKLRKEIEQEVGICTTTITKILREFNLIPQKKEKIPIQDGFESEEDFKQLIILFLFFNLDNSINLCIIDVLSLSERVISLSIKFLYVIIFFASMNSFASLNENTSRNSITVS